MKNLILIIGLLLLAIINLNAQTFEWAKRIGGISSDFGTSIAVDASGNVYTTGYFEGTADFNPGSGTFSLTAVGNSDIFISKLDAFGDFVWAKRIGGTGNDISYSISLDIFGNVYTTGCFVGTADFDPGSGIYNLTAINNNLGIFISKLDASGNFIWAKSMGGAGNVHSYSVELDAFGNVYTTGNYSDTIDFDPGAGIFNLIAIGYNDIFVSKLDPLGNFVWAKSMGGTNYIYGKSIALDFSGNVYTTGYYYGTVDFDPGIGIVNLTAAGGNGDVFISKLDASGNFVWAESMGGASTDYSFSIAIDASNNVYTTGTFSGTADFNPGTGIYNLTSVGNKDIFISKLDSSGNFVYAKSIGGINEDISYSIALDTLGNVYNTGNFSGTVDFDPGAGTCNITSVGYDDIFILKLDASGNFILAKSMGGTNYVYGNSIAMDASSNIYTTGYFYGTVDFDPGDGIWNLTGAGGTGDIFVLKLNQKGVSAVVYNDINQNCTRDINETGLPNRYIMINPGNMMVQTNEAGYWYVDSLPVGTYTITVDTSGIWSTTCFVTQTFSINDPNVLTCAPNFGLFCTHPCASPEVSVYMPFIRPCFSDQLIYVNACNQNVATGALNNAYVDVELDSLIIPQSATIAYTSLGNNTYRFQLGNLNPGQCVNFIINCNVSCNAVFGRTLCIQANIYPADSCVFDTIPDPFPGEFTPCTLPWDHSSLNVEGYCQNDSIYFVISNTGDLGNGDMDCFSSVRVYIDGVYYLLDSIQLVGGDTAIFAFAGDGRTWRLEADQHPLHPGNSHPNATIEACGDSTNWTPGLVNVLPSDDADPFVDVYCGVATGSFDPNDKIGYPTGVTSEHHIMPNQQLQYVIRFQNTGTDTAFTVIVRDTLDFNLDVFSVVPGVSSHNYIFRMYGPRVLEWTFNNILLPDSNHNQVGSNGFVTFTVSQNNNLLNGTSIYNSADIYFDYNVPVITNQTVHSINDRTQTNIKELFVSNENNCKIVVFPNPSNDKLHVLTNNSNNTFISITIYNIQGKSVKQLFTKQNEAVIDISGLEQGVYGIRAIGGSVNCSERFVIVR